jgi:hypothetical protein
MTGSKRRTLGIDDLVHLAVHCGGRRTPSWERYQTLRTALGVATDLLDPRGRPNKPPNVPARIVREHGHSHHYRLGTPTLAAKAVAEARRLHALEHGSIFSSYLEAPPDIVEVEARHHEQLADVARRANRAKDDLARELMRVAADAVRTAEPDVAERRVPMSELVELGWPDDPPPPVIDPWEDYRL